jgi:trk system potassium uptake protein TrkH
MGIVVLFVAVFPGLGVGGKHMFRSEVPGVTAEGLVPRIAQTSFTLWRIYAGLTLACVACLWACGLTPFEAVCHAFTALSTGGFSTLDSSVGGFRNPAAEWTLTFFMLVAGMNFALFYAALRSRSVRPFLKSTEFRVYLAIAVICTIVVSLGILPEHGWRPLEALRYGAFTVGTFLTSTGFGVEDYMTYSPPVLMIIVVIMVIGACSGSTAGGVKVERITLMMKMAFAQFRQTFRPNVVAVVRMNDQGVEGRVLREVAVLVIVYGVTLATCTFLVLLFDPVRVDKAFGAVLSCLSNMGPAPFHGGADHFAFYSDLSKLVFSAAMVLGRLEFYTLLALLVPDFWRR